MAGKEEKNTNFNAIRLKLASAEEIHQWSHGEVTKPETINYRTQRPEKDGLFCERIFGPSKDWECYCGKYKRIRYKGIICDKCGVEVTRSIVRRERMGHIDLAAPVSHIWFLRGVPSKIGLILGLSVQNLEKVIYFASFVITKVDEELRQETIDQVEQEWKSKQKNIENSFNQKVNTIKQQKKQQLEKAKDESAKAKINAWAEQELVNNARQKDQSLKELAEAADLAKKELRNLKPLQIISENSYLDLSLKYGHVFEAGIGAEAVRQLLADVDLEKMKKELEKKIASANKNRKKKLLRRLRLITNLTSNKIKPESMILTTIPVIPPDLRPMVQLDGGRFAASDLNDLYRRVINRNNRLKRLLELNAPEVITRNEKRMLQEAVDALIDNGARHGKTVTASTGQKRQLKSLADMLKGKQGRFRQNLLGKRVDYSGRSVIVIGPYLKIGQCGLPKTMALELFKPFVISQLIKGEHVHNVRSASRLIETGKPEVWDILEKITKDSHVLLNRAPTLHRLGIQAFQPVLIEGKAIQIHPLICAPFNADFDGDQMAVHLPLTEGAKKEASEIMLSAKNLLKPATGEPVTTPSQDIVLGCYNMTLLKEVPKEKMKNYSCPEEAIMSFRLGYLDLQQKIGVQINGQRLETNCGRLIINGIFPDSFAFINEVMDKKMLKNIVSRCLQEQGREETAEILDKLKEVSFEYITTSGITWGMDDLPILEAKKKLMAEADKQVDEIQGHFESGLLTAEERHIKIVEIWANLKDKITDLSKEVFDQFNPVHQMIQSGARGSWSQITQMMGMKGLVTNPAGETIELPVKGSFKEGFDVLEYFISTHGARKGLSDTALRTANAGYLTRRLVDVAQDMVISCEDCGDSEGRVLTKKESEEMGETLAKRITGRTSLERITDPKTKKLIVKKDELITEEIAEKLKKIDLTEIKIRTNLTCQAPRGLCQKCYGYDLGYNQLVKKGTAVGVVAAQSIGEPGTQLTMRTFHTGGVAGSDITQGLPRVEELFEARPVKKSAVISEVDGRVESVEEVLAKDGKTRQKLIKVRYTHSDKEQYPITEKTELKVKDKQEIKKGDLLAVAGKKKIMANSSGVILVKEKTIEVKSEKEKAKEYLVSPRFNCWVKEGDLVTTGQQLTEGSIDLHQLHKLRGKKAVEKYIVKEIQYIYSSQGQKLNDKHLEIIVRKMFSRFHIKDSGETNLLPGEIIENAQLKEANLQVQKEGKKEAVAENLLLGITKASLSTESFLSAASFQETARVLIDAAVSGKVDRLRGLKENVIIGRQIPAGTGYPDEKKDKECEEKE